MRQTKTDKISWIYSNYVLIISNKSLPRFWQMNGFLTEQEASFRSPVSFTTWPQCSPIFQLSGLPAYTKWLTVLKIYKQVKYNDWKKNN